MDQTGTAQRQVGEVPVSWNFLPPQEGGCKENGRRGSLLSAPPNHDSVFGMNDIVPCE